MNHGVLFTRWLLFLSLPLGAMLISRRLVMYYQLASYQWMGFFRTIKRQWKRSFLPGLVFSLVSFGLVILFSQVRPQSPFWAVVYPLIGVLLILGVGKLGDIYDYRQREGKSRLHMTGRVYRLYTIWLILGFLFTILLGEKLNAWGLGALFYLVFPLWVCLCALVAWPLERLIYELYFQDARRILKERKDLLVIAITGSYGKTSVKFYLQTILSQKYSALCTQSSRNTPMGISRSIRDDLEPGHRIFIVEMGAKHRGDIKELCRLVKPSIGILTSVGPQHLETFGDIEAIKNTKYDLIRALPKDGLAVFGEDHGIVRQLYENTRDPKAIVGGEADDLWAENVVQKMEDEQPTTEFTLCSKDGLRLDCSVPVVGANVVGNILMAAAVALSLGLTAKQLEYGIALIAPVRHRFKIEKGQDGVHRINNGFNSNPVSSAATLTELASGRYPGRKIIVTPGFIELGKAENQYNRELGINLSKVADIVLLVGTKRTQPIYEGLQESDFPLDNIHVFDTLHKANQWIEEHKREGDYVLYENDLPDQYSEVR